jgi:hypothetical protein
VKVSWDDEIPNIWKVMKIMFQTTNQIYLLVVIEKKLKHQPVEFLDPPSQATVESQCPVDSSPTR